MLTVISETLHTISLPAKSLIMIFKMNLYSAYIHLYEQFLNITHRVLEMTASIQHIVPRPWSFIMCSLVA